jgi:single-stranded-DNA-specific exonuclease
VAETIKAYKAEPYSYDEAKALSRELGVSDPVAITLVRRGYRTPEEARAFLDADESHEPGEFRSMDAVVTRIRGAIEAGQRITVHGDFDVDGVCATTIMVSCLRELGADCDWLIPDRISDGYGLTAANVEVLAARGTKLIVTVDCGVTAVEPVAHAKELGIDVVVTDHHQPGDELPDCLILHPSLDGYPFGDLCGTAVAWKLSCGLREARAAGLDVIVTDHHRPGDELPDCPIVATRPSDYPFPELCGTGVVYKLAEALLGPDDERLARNLDLVALATIADVVPLVDENRALALAGLRGLATTQRPGLRALMQASRVDAAVVDEGAVGFRLAPRINAAGRLGRPTAALELLLTDSEDDARRIAQELEELNRERQAVEERILREATAEIDSWPEARRRRRGYVVAGESWHEGVIGIVASRLVERYNRPVVLIAGTEGDWKGSGRSISSYDLHGGLAACAGHLERFGGHRAAAGLSIRPENVDALADAFAAHADEHLVDGDLRAVTTVDAIVPGAALTLSLCAELRRLAPFGLGNPGVNLLVAGCELTDLNTVGDGKHLRFRVSDSRGPAGTAIAFGLGKQLDRFRRIGYYDVAFRLQENTWNGTTSPQLVVRRIFETPDRYLELRDGFAAEWRAQQLSPEARLIAEELALEAGGPWRSLLESPTFRSLLEEVPLPLAA